MANQDALAKTSRQASASSKGPDGEIGLGSVDRYIDHLNFERQLSPHTQSNYRRDLERLASLSREHAKSTPLEKLEHHHIRRFAMLMHGEGLGARSIARTLSSWRTFYKWLALHGADSVSTSQPAPEMKANPVGDVRAPKAGKRLPKALSADLAVQLVSQPSEEGPLAIRDAAMFELLYSSGLRLSEIVGLDEHYVKVKDHESKGWINFDAAEVTVTGKGNKKRMVPVGAAALTALQEWLTLREMFLKPRANDVQTPVQLMDQTTDQAVEPTTRQTANQIRERTKKQAHHAHALFLSERGTRLTGRSIEQRLKAHAIRLGMPAKVHPHMLRHSFASHVLQSSGDLRAVQEMLGHASIAATQVYTSLDFQRLAQVYDQAHPRAKKK